MWHATQLLILDYTYKLKDMEHLFPCNLHRNQRPSQPGTIHFLIGKFSYFVIRFLYQIFFVINFSYLVIRFLLNRSMVKPNNEIGKVNDKKI